MTRFVLVRHGESQANQEKRFAGWLDTPLTGRGKEQAALTAEYLKTMHFDAAYGSDLVRAYETGLAAIQYHPGLNLIPDTRLREIDGGRWEGILFEDLNADWPEAYRLWRFEMHKSQCPEGENVHDLQKRICAELICLAEKHPGETVLIATHATPIRVMELIFRGLPMEEIGNVSWVPNASVTIVEYDEGKWNMTLRGYDGHLGALSTVLPNTI